MSTGYTASGALGGTSGRVRRTALHAAPTTTRADGGSRTRALVSATAGTAGTRIGTLLVSLVAGVVAARALGPHDRGLLAVAIASSAVFSTMFALGIDTANLRLAGRSAELHRYAALTSVRYALPLGVAAGTVWGLVGYLGGPTARLGLDPATFRLTLALCPVVLLAALLGAAEIGRGRAATYNLTVIGSLVAYLAALVLLVAVDRANPATVLGAYLLGQVGGLVVLLRQVVGSRHLARPAAETRREYWSSARRGFAPNVAHFSMVRVQVPLTQVLIGASAVGVYSVALALAETLLIVPIALSLILVPTVANGHADWHQVARLAGRSLVVTVLSAAALAAAGPLLVATLYGDRFAPAVPVLWALLPGVVIFALARVAQSYLTATDRPAGTLVAAVAASVVGCGLMVALVPRFGPVGAGVAASAGFVVYATVIAAVFLRLNPARRAVTATTPGTTLGESRPTGGRTPRRGTTPPHGSWDGWFLALVLAVIGGAVASVAVSLGPGLPLSTAQLVGAVVVAVLATLLPSVGLYGLALLGPLSQLPALPLPAIPAMLVCGLCCLFGTVLRRRLPVRNRTAAALLVALVSWLLISITMINPDVTLPRAFSVVAVVALPLVVLPLVAPEGGLGGRVMLTFAFATAGVGLVRLVTVAREGDLASAGPLAGDAPTYNHNAWGCLLVIALAVLLARLAGTSRPPLRALTLAAVLLTLVSTGYSYSRSAYLGALAVLVCFALRRPARSVAWAGLVAAVTLALGVTSALLPSTIVDRITGTATGDTLDLSSSIRLDLWTAALRMAADHPVLGVGYLNFNTRLAEYFVPTQTDAHAYTGLEWSQLAHPHNQYLMLLTETGLVGTLLVGGLLVLTVRSVWRRYRARVEWTAEAALLALLGVGIASLTGEPLLAPAVLVPFLLLLSTATRSTP
ncbi:O-antigen ligase family protein [Micromonospora sp. MA102]|uniref:O-antigen ligase family protein n=1 Tax=Micromonospora sp. MA102 TaxID=2952755 RepID=UPI0021C8D1F6|nr:O-antigen ligase family protein [Micromonospora sp. MA102]